MKKGFLLINLLYIFYSCSIDNSFKDCIHGKPRPLFSENHEDVKEHSFKLKKEESIEKINFVNGDGLTVRQSGCEVFTQVLEFKIIRENFPFFELEDWKKLGTQKLKEISLMGGEYIAYQSWASLIDKKIDTMDGINLTEISTGFYASLNVTEDSVYQIITFILTDGN